MIQFQSHFDGKTIVPDEPVDLPRNQALVVRVEPVQDEAQPPASTFLEWTKGVTIDPEADFSQNLEMPWDEFVKETAGAWQGPPLTRPDQGELQERAGLE